MQHICRQMNLSFETINKRFITNKFMKIERKHLFPFLWFGFIIYASLTPSKDLPNFVFFSNFDKVVHFGIYFVLAILTIPFLLQHKKYLQSYLTSGIVSILIGILFEVLQFYIGHGRSASPFDALANSLGALSGIIVYHFVIRAKKIEKLIFKIE